MGRYRPPDPPKSPYITTAGYQRLQQEQQSLWLRRRDVTEALSAAAAEGDRSENAEYIYRKKELRELDRRIRYLQKRLPSLRVVDQPPQNRQQVFFGAWVTLKDERGKPLRYRIVGPDETDCNAHYISLDSPVAQALMKKEIGDQVTVQTPSGAVEYSIESIEYE